MLSFAAFQGAAAMKGAYRPIRLSVLCSPISWEAPMHSNEMNVPGGERWFYEIGDRTHGPHSRSDLEELLSNCGEMAFVVRIRNGPDGEWIPYKRPVTPAEQPVSALTRASLPGASRPATSTRSKSDNRSVGLHKSLHWPPGQRKGQFRSLLGRHAAMATMVGAWLLGNLVIVLSSDTHRAERVCVAALRQMM